MFPGTTLRLAICGAMADGEALLGAYASSVKLDTANWLRFDVSNSVGDSFLKNQSWLRAELRAYLAIARPASFALVTGLVSAEMSPPGGSQPAVLPGA